MLLRVFYFVFFFPFSSLSNIWKFLGQMKFAKFPARGSGGGGWGGWVGGSQRRPLWAGGRLRPGLRDAGGGCSGAGKGALVSTLLPAAPGREREAQCQAEPRDGSLTRVGTSSLSGEGVGWTPNRQPQKVARVWQFEAGISRGEAEGRGERGRTGIWSQIFMGFGES